MDQKLYCCIKGYIKIISTLYGIANNFYGLVKETLSIVDIEYKFA